MVKRFIYLIIFLMFAFGVQALECGQKITVDTTLYEDYLCPEQGFILGASDMTLDCQGHKIYGKGLGNGVEVIGVATTIKDCVIDGFENGLLITHVSKIRIEDTDLKNNLMGAHVFDSEDVSFSRGTVANNSFYGIYSKDSTVTNNDVIFSDNRQDFYELSTKSTGPRGGRVAQARREQEQVVEGDRQIGEEEKEAVSDNIKESLSDATPIILKVPLEIAKEILKKVGLEKEVTIGDGKTEYDLTLIPKQDLRSVQITEEIPIEVAQKAKDIDASMPFTVVQEGDDDHGPTIRFNLVDLKKDQAKIVKYAINKEVLSEFALKPSTFLLLEEAINPGALWTIRLLFSLSLILLACFLYLSKSLHRHHHFLIHLSVFCVGVLLFVMFNLKIEIMLTEQMNNMIMGSVLGLAVIVLLGADIRFLWMRYKHPEEKKEVDELEF